MSTRQREIVVALLALCGSTFIGVLLITASAPGVAWRVALGVVLVVVIIDNLWLLLGRERWISRFLRFKRS
jgi:hypothetical protein